MNHPLMTRRVARTASRTMSARTVESQTHRQMASGLSMPVGFKNSTAGDCDVAVNAIVAATQEQTFLGITAEGRASAVLAEHLDRRVLREVEFAFGRRLVVALDAVFLDERNDAFAEGVLSRGRAGGKQEQ